MHCKNIIISFLPSATEILYELDAQDCLMAVTHQCTFPPAALKKKKAISLAFDTTNMSSQEIDAKIEFLFKNNLPIYNINEKLLNDSKADLIISQDLCKVCSPYSKEVAKVLEIIKPAPEVLSVSPNNLQDILKSVITISERIGIVEKGRQIYLKLEKKIENVVGKVGSGDISVACIEWINPLYTSGHWIPEILKIAGGKDLLGLPGHYSRKTTMQELIRSDPEYIILMPCGFNVRRILSEYHVLQRDPQWNSLRAVKRKKAFAVDAGNYFSNSGPRVITGLEILAKILHPQRFSDLIVPKGSFVKL